VAVHYSVRDSGDVLRIDVCCDLPLWERLLGVVIVVIVVATAATSSHLPNIWTWILAVAVGAIVFVFGRQVTARLTATKFEFRAVRRKRYGGNVSLPTAKIQRLEFQERSSGLQGLYAVTSWRDQCIVPYVDEVQAGEITNAIVSKFPGLAEMWRQTKSAAYSSSEGKSGGLL
jgi:hypothetical protein